MTTEVELFSAGRALADARNVPTGQGRWQQHYSAREARMVVIGRMLAQVAVIPMLTDRCTLVGVDGDPEMLDALTARSDGRTLHIEGDLPFKPGGGNGPFSGTFFSGGNVTMTVGGAGGSFYSSGGRSMFLIDGREVDIDRYIRLVLAVPAAASVQVRGLIGAAGIAGDLDGDVDFSPSCQAELVTAGRVGSLTGDITGSGSATIGAVDGNAEIEISGSGSILAGSVGGAVDARVSGSGSVAVEGGHSTRLRASVSGSGSVQHHGTVAGDARLRVSGSGHIRASVVRGDLDPKVSGSGSITANGQTYRPRW